MAHPLDHTEKRKKKILNGELTLSSKVITRKETPDQRYRYRPEYVDVAKRLMRMGATRREVAEQFDVHVGTIYHWMFKYPEFERSLRAGADSADRRVENALYEKATGYKWDEEVKTKEIDENGEEVEKVTVISKQLPPDNGAIMFWLKNRQSHKWKDKHEVTVTQNINVLTTQELERLVSQTITDAEYTEVDVPQIEDLSAGNSV